MEEKIKKFNELVARVRYLEKFFSLLACCDHLKSINSTGGTTIHIPDFMQINADSILLDLRKIAEDHYVFSINKLNSFIEGGINE